MTIRFLPSIDPEEQEWDWQDDVDSGELHELKVENYRRAEE